MDYRLLASIDASFARNLPREKWKKVAMSQHLVRRAIGQKMPWAKYWKAWQEAAKCESN
jgi:hypothetical protein